MMTMADGWLAADHIDTSVVSLAIVCHRHHHHHPLSPLFQKNNGISVNCGDGGVAVSAGEDCTGSWKPQACTQWALV